MLQKKRIRPMPSGRSLRIFATASRTSLTARSTGVPIWNSTNTFVKPSIARELDVAHAADAGDGAFDLLRHLRLDLARRGTRLRHRHGDQRERDVGIEVDGQPDERHDAEEPEHRRTARSAGSGAGSPRRKCSSWPGAPAGRSRPRRGRLRSRPPRRRSGIAPAVSDHALVAVQALGDHEPSGPCAADTHRAALVRCRSSPRSRRCRRRPTALHSAAAPDVRTLPTCTSARANAPGRSAGAASEMRTAEARLRIDHCAEQPHLAGEGFAMTGEIDRLAWHQARQIPLRDLAAHFDLSAAREPEQRLAARRRGLPDFGVRVSTMPSAGARIRACRAGPALRRAAPPRLSLSLRRRPLPLAAARSPRPKGAGGVHPCGARYSARRSAFARASSSEASRLPPAAQHRLIEPRQHLPRADASPASTSTAGCARLRPPR